MRNDQRGDNNKYTNIENAHPHLSIHIDNRTCSNTQYRQLEAEDPSLYEKFTDNEVNKKGGISIISIVALILINFLGIFSDLYSFLEKFNISRDLVTIVIYLAIVFTLVVNRKEIAIFLAKYGLFFPKVDETNNPFLFGKFLMKENGSFYLYRMKGKCIYEGRDGNNCGGDIIIVPPPEREKGKYRLCAKCSIEGEGHSYIVRRSGVAIMKELDWRKIDKK